MKMKKVISLIMAATLAVSVLSGCGKTGDTVQQTAAQSSTAGSNKAGPKELKVTIFAHQLMKDLESFNQFKDLEAKTGVKIKWEYVRSDYDEKISLMFAGAELPDVILDGLNMTQIGMFKSSLAPIDQYISQEKTPNIYKAFQEDSTLKNISTNLDGHIYALGNKKPFRPNSTSLWMINKTWLDKLKLQVPTTLDELKNVLIAFRDKDPNGNGKKDEIPMDWNNDNNQNVAFSALNLTAAFGKNPTWIDVENGKVSYLPISEEYKKTVAYLHELYKEKLINTEVFTQGYAQMQARAQNESVPLVGFTFGWDIPDRTGKWASQYITIAPLKANASITPKTPNDAMGLQYQQICALTPKTGNEEFAVQWLDNFYTDDMAVQNYFGPIGTVTEKTDSGYATKDIPEGQTMDAWQWTNSMKDGAPMYYSPVLEGKTKVWQDALNRLKIEKVYDPYRVDQKKDMFPLVQYNEEDTKKLSLELDMQSIIYPKWSEWIVNGGIEKEWDSYVKQIESLGLKDLIDVWQRAYDNFYK